MPVTHWNFTVNVMLKRNQFIYETVQNELVNVGLKRSVSFASLIRHCMMCDKKLFSCYDITEKEYCGIFLLRSCTNFCKEIFLQYHIFGMHLHYKRLIILACVYIFAFSCPLANFTKIKKKKNLQKFLL